MKTMFTIMHIEIENEIHWVKSVISTFDHKYNKVKCFPHVKRLNNREYLYITKTEGVYVSC